MPSHYPPRPRALLSRPPAPRNLPQSPRQLICAGAGALRRRKWSHSVARTPHLGVAMESRGRRSRLSASHVRSVRPPDLHLASPLLASTRTRLAHVSIQAWFPRPPGAHYVTPLPYILRSTMKDRPRRLCRRFLLSRNRRGRRSHSRPLASISTIDSFVVVLHWKAHPRDTVRSVGTYAAQAPLARRQIQSSGTSHVPPWQNAASTPPATPHAKACSSPSFAQHACMGSACPPPPLVSCWSPCVRTSVFSALTTHSVGRVCLLPACRASRSSPALGVPAAGRGRRFRVGCSSVSWFSHHTHTHTLSGVCASADSDGLAPSS